MSQSQTSSSTMDDIVQQASEWLVCLSEDNPAPSSEQYSDFKIWQEADPRHAQAVSQLEKMMGRIKELPAGPARSALENAAANSHQDWRKPVKALSIIFVLFLPLWLLMSQLVPQQRMTAWLADEHTSGGEWRTHQLSDDSSLVLAANTAVNIQFNPERRSIELLSGEILVDVAQDTSRPFIVETSFGNFTALGTRFTVFRGQQSTVLTVIESRVSVQLNGVDNVVNNAVNNGEVALEPGQRITLYADGTSVIDTSLDPGEYEADWRAHQLVVLDRPLPEVLAHLAHYYPGRLHYDSTALSSLRISAVLPLDDPERALLLLSETVPIRVQSFTPWWTNVESTFLTTP